MTNPQNSDRTDAKPGQTDEHKPTDDDQRHNHPDRHNALADEWGDESFPASDPPGAP